MKTKNYHGRTGAGKSRKMKANIISIKGRHLLVVPRKNSIRECYDDLMQLARQAGVKINIHKFLRDDRTKRYSTKIAKEIIDWADRYQDDDHCCFIITQAAFQQLDLDQFEGWHLKLDELLTNGNPSGVLFAPIMWAGFASIYSVEPLTEEDLAAGIDPTMRRLCLRPDVEAKDVMQDPQLGKDQQNLFFRVASPIPVYIDATDIEEIGRRRCWWCSPWTLTYAEGFASIEIAACDIDLSLMHLLSPRPYDMELIPSPISEASIRIFYFNASEATCSSEYWKTDQGKANLELVGKEISRRDGVDFWTCNETAEPVLKPIMPKHSEIRERKRKDGGEAEVLNEIDGTWITQQQDGINNYRECLSCAIIISSKAQQHEEIFEKLNPAASRAAISKSREEGLIFQFASRGAPRCENFAGDYTIYVYDRQQAEALRDKLLGYGFPQTEIEHIDLPAFTNRERPAKGRKPTYSTPKERKEAQLASGKARVKKCRAKKAHAEQADACKMVKTTPIVIGGDDDVE